MIRLAVLAALIVLATAGTFVLHPGIERIVICETEPEIPRVGLMWSHDIDGGGRDVVLFGQAAVSPIDVDALRARMRRPDRRPVTPSLGEVGFWSLAEQMSTYAGREPGPRLEGAQINTDRSLRLLYPAGMGLNLHEGAGICNDTLVWRRHPERVVTGSAECVSALGSILAPGGAR